MLTGVFLIGGPLFKQTGVAAIAAVGLFVLAGPILHHYAWKKAGQDILLLVAGAFITMTPICAWYASMSTPLYYWPYSFALGPVFKLAGADLKYVADTGQAPQEPVAQARRRTAGEGVPTQGQDARHAEDSLILRLLPGYVSDSWRMLSAADRKEALHRVLRYYRVLILPIALAFGALVARIVVLLRRRQRPTKTPSDEDPGRFVLLLGLWWFFDMAFVWISPHSYEQYYLPLNASSAMLGGYFVGLYAHRFQADRDKTRWIVLGLVGVLTMLVLSWHIFFGLSLVPAQRHARPWISRRASRSASRDTSRSGRRSPRIPRYPWLEVGDYIRQNSDPADLIYVWGWVPGIYVQAQRMTNAPKAFEGMMHTLPPPQLAERVQELVVAFEKKPPKFIVDTRKIHFPWNRPPLELWPRMKDGFLPPEEKAMKQYDTCLWQAV